jgi:Ca2+-binding EF-hand superfamily protein
MLAALIFITSVDFITASDVTPRGGFMIGRIAAKKIKKMREQENFSGADQNKDGKVDKHEIDYAKKTHNLSVDDETFKKIDKNGDGMLSHEECEKYHEEMEKSVKAEDTTKAGKGLRSILNKLKE